MKSSNTSRAKLAQNGPDPIQHINLDDKVCLRIRDMIAKGTLIPGQRVIQEDLADMLGISRTPLVNALKRLSQEGLLEWVPRRGIYVRSLDPEELVQLYELRERLEPMAAELAASRIETDEASTMHAQWSHMKDLADTPESHALFIDMDRRFHLRLAELGANPYLQAALAPVNMLATLYLHGNPRPWDETVPDHLTIIEALAQRNPAASGAAMRLHISKSLEVLRVEAKQPRSAPTK